MKWTVATIVGTLFLASCVTEEPDEAVCSSSSDADSDGLDDCTEEDLGTNAQVADSDDDGFSDAEEIDCVSDPLDGEEQCYACGWEHNDPGTLESNGSDIGDVVSNITLTDQCGDDVRLWDFYGGYHILYMTAAW